MGVNKVILLGNVGKDPDVRYVEKDKAVAQLSLATSERVASATGESTEVTEWHRLVMWGPQAQVAEKYIRKGTKLYVEGKLRTRVWEDRNAIKHSVTEIIVENFEILSARQ